MLVLGVICAASLFAQASPAQSPGTETDKWKPLRFLVGTWEAKTQGGSAGAAGNGTYMFRLELRAHLLVRHAATAECKGPDDFDCEHGDILYIYAESPGQPFKAIYFDNEGHVIHYTLSMPEDRKVVFLSDAPRPGPQYRLSYELKDDVMSGRFEMHMPGRAEFTTYLEWSGKKR